MLGLPPKHEHPSNLFYIEGREFQGFVSASNAEAIWNTPAS